MLLGDHERISVAHVALAIMISEEDGKRISLGLIWATYLGSAFKQGNRAGEDEH
jgi:hypothetical protein